MYYTIYIYIHIYTKSCTYYIHLYIMTFLFRKKEKLPTRQCLNILRMPCRDHQHHYYYTIISPQPSLRFKHHHCYTPCLHTNNNNWKKADYTFVGIPYHGAVLYRELGILCERVSDMYNGSCIPLVTALYGCWEYT